MRGEGSGNGVSSQNESGKKESQASTKVQLQREIGLTEAVALIVGGIIGSGIFISPKGVYEFVGSVGMSLVLWAVCGLISLSGALCFTELGTAMPSSGGQYFYLYEVFGPIPAFLYMWCHVWILAPAGTTIVALAFAHYASQAVFPIGCHIPETAVTLLAAVVISFLIFLNCYDVRSTVKLQNIFLVAKISPLVFIILAGILSLFWGDGENLKYISFQHSNLDPGSISLALYIGFFSYGGWQVVHSITEELVDPNRNMPLAIYISIPLVATIYILANVAYFCVLSPLEVLASDAVAVTFMEKLFGRFGWIMSVFVATSTFGSISVYIMATSRQLFVGARTGQCPEILGYIKTSRLTPTPALILLGLLSLCYLCTSDIFALINYTSYVYNITNLGVILAFVKLRWNKPDLYRPIKVSIVHPIIFFLASIFLAIFPIYSSPVAVGIGLLIGLSGLPAYCLFFQHTNQQDKHKGVVRRKWRALDTVSGSVTRSIQKVFLCLPEDPTL